MSASTLPSASSVAPSDKASVALDEWLRWDRNEKTRHSIEALRDRGDWATLEKILCSRMQFGTAGLRAAMGPGNACMNDLTIIQTAQGLAAYLMTQFSDTDIKTRGITIGYDGRHNSSRFARLSGNVFKNAGFKVYLFSRVTPTPFVAYGVRLLQCVAGVMVTASHNPKEDNGYKVYWQNGAQILSPHDKGITKAILDNLEPFESSWNDAPDAEDPLEKVETAYYQSLQQLCAFKAENTQTPIRFAYSAMHGVGGPYTMKALELFGFLSEQHVIPVAEQFLPDPEFPTVQFPNPEEGKSALVLSMATAERSGAQVILANDPDADRLGMAERRADDDGSWHVFNGNQMGALLGWWAIFNAKRNNTLTPESYFITTAVNSRILITIATKENIKYYETLTGFKWMGNRADELQREGKDEMLLAYEEAIGFMYGSRVMDKDGVSAAAVLAEMAAYLQREEGNKTLLRKLDEIYEEYGYHLSNNSYVIANDPKKTWEMFTTLQQLEDGHYPTNVAGANVLGVRDLISGVDTRMPDHKATLPLSTTSPMITFWLDNDVTLTLRSSGTEPKLKWYAELVTKDKSDQAKLDAFVADAFAFLARPAQYGFKSRA